MNSIKTDILSCLKKIKGAGKFVSVHTETFVFPGMEVSGAGEISYPVNAIQAKALIEIAQKAPFGKGSKTILDDAVRRAWEIDAAQLHFKGEQWTNFLNKAVTKIKEDLGLEDYSVSASLYKMLVYEKGDFFLTHKDSEKEKGMFGTLIVVLPSQYTGGELAVRFDGMEETADFAKASAAYKISFAAFYADCDHEIKPLTSGYRVCLVYNLIQKKPDGIIQHTSLGAYVQQLAALFKKPPQAENRQPYIILLGHQYTPENFSYNALKLNDRPKAEALLQAAKKAACYGKMCLVTSFLSGAPEYDGYYGDDIDDDTEMAEVYDEQQSIEHWLESDIPALTDIPFDEEDLIASFALDEGEPIIKESTGYMGNYGPDINHWYHYGAVVIWSKEVNAQLLFAQDTVSKLKWLRYFCENYDETSYAEIASAEIVLSAGLEKAAARENADYNAIADWVILQGDKSFFKKISTDPLRLYFNKIETGHWMKLFAFLPAENIHEIIGRVMEEAQPETMEQLLSLLHSILTDGNLKELATPHIKQLPFYFETMLESRKASNPSVKGQALQDLFRVSEFAPQSEDWMSRLVAILTGHKNRGYINSVLLPAILALPEQNHLTQQLLLTCRTYFQQIAANVPQPPADWSRPVPDTTHYKKQWEILRPFLQSPVQTVFEYRKNQGERNELENAIENVEIDLKTETIKKGSPHTLKITKTQADYNKRMKEWKEDVALLEKVVERLK